MPARIHETLHPRRANLRVLAWVTQTASPERGRVSKSRHPRQRLLQGYPAPRARTDAGTSLATRDALNDCGHAGRNSHEPQTRHCKRDWHSYYLLRTCLVWSDASSSLVGCSRLVPQIDRYCKQCALDSALGGPV